jgi:hypothetical protein
VWCYEIPVTLTDQDLSGAIWANQVVANNIISFTINPNFFLSNARAPTLTFHIPGL